MFNLTDILMQAQGGEAMQNLARQFGLSPDQTAKAVRAMMPAFAAAMQRQMTDPQALQNILAMMTAGSGYTNPYFDPMAAFTPDARRAGEDALAKLFGSKEVSRAVADQVAAMTGLGQNVLKSMLPVVAAMLMGGLATNMSSNPMGRMLQGFFGQGGGTGNIAEVMSAMLGGGAGAQSGLADMLSEMMKSMPRPTGGTETVDEMLKRTPNPAGPSSPLDETLGEFVRGFNRGRPEPEPEPEQLDVGEMLGQMFKAGRDVQDAQTKAFGEILDKFWNAGR